MKTGPDRLRRHRSASPSLSRRRQRRRRRSPPSYRSPPPLHQRRVTRRGSSRPGSSGIQQGARPSPIRATAGKPSPPPSWSSRPCSPSPGQDAMMDQASRQAV
ncbi:hypothetical protein BDA96_07G102900 [Sorghum bicolor]|uniref:Uncharacterized protein n=2 Tax=Sorghum bicolor TaxID=4558 RepID=A0A921QMJ9_SORBI|nr:hypothetical protein BDA96_07G102900 [Sorghum bicolor]OQU80219.1 hypothetical protein SORBI_3007G096600 [Sorghum bicolor]